LPLDKNSFAFFILFFITQNIMLFIFFFTILNYISLGRSRKLLKKKKKEKKKRLSTVMKTRKLKLCIFIIISNITTSHANVMGGEGGWLDGQIKLMPLSRATCHCVTTDISVIGFIAICQE
jgi:magnesium-transporting ATPase (P-type)